MDHILQLTPFWNKQIFAKNYWKISSISCFHTFCTSFQNPNFQMATITIKPFFNNYITEGAFLLKLAQQQSTIFELKNTTNRVTRVPFILIKTLYIQMNFFSVISFSFCLIIRTSAHVLLLWSSDCLNFFYSGEYFDDH